MDNTIGLRPCLNLLCWLLSVLLVAGTSLSCRRGTGISAVQHPAEAGPVLLEEPITYCWERPLRPYRGQVQILIDSSGSMTGFQQTVPNVVNWLQHGLSQLKTSTMDVQGFRLCQFSQAIASGGGIGNCTSGQNLPSYRPSANTNIHQAIRSAGEYGLSLIVTDGIAATGGRGASDCAAGVDASCVARSLRDALNVQPLGGERSDWGIWLVPLVANYQGTFYSEEPGSPASFRPEEVLQRLRADVGAQAGAEALVQGARSASDGTLIYQYRGPRALVLIVIARWADVGRAAVQAFWEQAGSKGLQRIEQMKEYASDLACMRPIEVYPGFVNAVQWEALKAPESIKDVRGTIDASLDSRSDPARISVSCPQGGSGEGVFTLTGRTSTSNRSSGCVSVSLLPAVAFRLRAVEGSDAKSLDLIVKGSRSEKSDLTQIRMGLNCESAIGQECGKQSVDAQWAAEMDYGKAADGFAATDDAGAAHKYIRELSTVQPSREPHRIHSLSLMLESFYRELGRDKRSIALSRIQFCYKP
jgi:hypothetical protein